MIKKKAIASEDAAVSTSRKTVDKAMQLLHAFSNDEAELSLTVLSERLGMHKSVVSRLVSCLCEWRMLDRDPVTKRIRLGMGVLQLGLQVANQNVLYRHSLNVLGKLVERTRHTAHVSVLDDISMLVIATVQSPDALRVNLRQGDRRPLHATAAGKIMLAYMSEHNFRAVVEDSGLPRLTNSTITDVRELEQHLQEVRRSGMAWNEGESFVGVGSCAAGVFDATGTFVGAITSVFPLNIVPQEQRKTIEEEVCRSARELSAALGWNH
ncbi:IclR family transcriptional regulator [Paracandidimonas soli]|uniref:IclR family transcriptional regulator n=1 Tax=Paracandidimonas soli TaxID=1917182 RepID=A0A4R3VFR9_9BURK|nr:IclR family transcriptional regulator [Paracandidimonas soli]TCV02863.1 IclR family transcriptional regulator [Paracandidimonas soli]